MILSGLAGKIRRFVRGNSRLIDKGNNVAAHIPLRLRIHDEPILNFGRGDMSAITLNVGRLSSLCIITFLCPRSQETEHGKKTTMPPACSYFLSWGFPQKIRFYSNFLPRFEAVVGQLNAKTVPWMGRETKQMSSVPIWSHDHKSKFMCLPDDRIFFTSTDW